MVGWSRQLTAWLVNVRVGMAVRSVVVRMPVESRPALQSQQGIDSKTNQHERDTKFEQTGNSIADSNVKENNRQTGDQERGSMSYAPKASDNRRTKKRFALSYDG